MRPIDPERNTLDDEHPQLASATRGAVGLVEQLHDTIGAVEGQSVWLQHSEFAWRAWYLSDHLASALDDADRARYASAFGTLRTAMEHVLVDRLLLMADRYIEVIETMTKEKGSLSGVSGNRTQPATMVSSRRSTPTSARGCGPSVAPIGRRCWPWPPDTATR